MDNKKLSMKIKVARTMADLNQVQLAEKAGLCLTTIYWVEKKGKCSLTSLKRICDALNLDFEKLMEEL